MELQELLCRAKEARAGLAGASGEDKNRALLKMAQALIRNREEILKENEKDLAAAENTISEVMKDRLRLTEDRLKGMAEGIYQVMDLLDPVGRVLEERKTPDGLKLKKVSVPLGVVAIIYESRPNVTADAAALCLKSGNVCILRGGKEAYFSSKAIVKALREGIAEAGLCEDVLLMVEETGRESAGKLMHARGYVDCLIPRGGAGLIRACAENATVPVIETGTGICSIFVDESADLLSALLIIENAKIQRPSVCNAAETLLVHEKVAGGFLPLLKKVLVDDRKLAGEPPVELRLCERAAALIEGTPAGPGDFDTEFLDYILAVKVVKDVREAAAHIAAHSTHHSEAIVSENEENIRYFTETVDSACVYVNASTRFTDGGCFGLGCEMGISTQRLHARGPMGLKELTTYKYILTGDGHVRRK